ncbi:MAG: OmpA family protein [Dysgonamonadaceae bacterium]|jgi:peptidoglycan-associated lipoprotein|nr:OmpA family protein [Dysgonamonadaceae bacterium]
MRKLILISIAVCFAIKALSQQQDAQLKQQNRHEFSAGGGIGMSALLNNISTGSKQTKFGYNVGLGYTYFLDYNWGISTGFELSHLSTGVEIGRLTDQSLVWSSYFDYYHAEIQYTKEEHEFYHINIPLIARYRFDLPKQSLKPYVAAGIKAGIPVKNSYHTQRTLTSWGDNFPDLKGYTKDPFENMPNHGFYTSLPIDYRSEFKKKLYLSGTIEAGINYAFNNKTSIYAGIFADFGLNNIVDRSERDLLGNPVYPDFSGYNHRKPAEPVINSVLISAYGYVTPDDGGIKHETPFFKRVNTLSAGIKVGITYGIKPFDKKDKAKVIAPYEDPWDKPITGKQMQQLLDKQTADLTDAQRKEIEKLKQFLTEEQEQPDLSAPIYCFDFDKHNIPADMRAILDHKADLMKKHPSICIILEGHTDSAGSDKYNYNLGLRRANAAKYYLVLRGISSGRLVVTSKGRSEPIIRNIKGDNDANCPNRRVEFIIKK